MTGPVPDAVAHLLWSRDRDHTVRRSRCGNELRRTWKPVTEFMRPEAFTQCGQCTAGAGQ